MLWVVLFCSPLLFLGWLRAKRAYKILLIEYSFHRLRALLGYAEPRKVTAVRSLMREFLPVNRCIVMGDKEAFLHVRGVSYMTVRNLDILTYEMELIANKYTSRAAYDQGSFRLRIQLSRHQTPCPEAYEPHPQTDHESCLG